MIILVILLGLLVVGVLVLCYIGSQPKMHKEIHISRIRSFLEVLIKKGGDEDCLVVSPPKSNQVFRIIRYEEGRQSGLFIYLANSGWLSENLGCITSILDKKGVRYTREENAKNGSLASVVVDFETDLEKAEKVIRMLLVDVLSLGDEATFDAHFEIEPKRKDPKRIET